MNGRRHDWRRPSVPRLLPRHRNADRSLRVNQMVGAFRRVGDRELYALDPAVERVAVRPVIGRNRSAGVLADIATIVACMLDTDTDTSCPGFTPNVHASSW